MNWDKQRDTFRVEIPTESQRLTKRNILKTLASIYDPLGFISPVLLIGKILFRNLCDLRIPWDNEIPQEIENKWVKWVNGLNIKIEIPRSISIRETITNIGYTFLVMQVSTEYAPWHKQLHISQIRLTKV